jgi:lantibiotic modifying enzyme
VAVALGARVCRDALRAGDRCNWTGFSMESLDGRWRHAHRAYGPEVYGGTSGIGLFLARLHAAAGERVFRRTALGALRNALARAEDVEPFSRIGNWSGWSGLGLAVLEAAAILGEDSLREPALALLGRIAAGEVDLKSYDALAGSAGAIPALLRVHRGLGGPDSFVEAAIRLGDHLIGTAVRSDAGWSWGEIPAGSKQKGNLTGFSHGAGGIGWALYELWGATGEERFRGAGEEAFRYERHWYDPERRNWPDLRDPELAGSPATDAPAFMSAWCHGAPGIALSRLRVWELNGDETCRAEAEAALDHTAEHVLGGEEMSQTNYSLCHGLGGNCDVLLQGARILGNPAWQLRAEEIARRGIEAHHLQKLPWPCGTYGGVEVPGLMLGLSGIGWFYLRLADETVPSALIVEVG